MGTDDRDSLVLDYYRMERLEQPLDETPEPWFRWLPAMRVFGVAILVLSLLIATPWQTPGGFAGAAAMGLLGMLAAAFAVMWIYKPIWRHDTRLLAVHGPFLVVTYGLLLAISPGFAVLQLLIYPQVVFSMRLRWSAAGGVAIGLLTALSVLGSQSGDWAAAAPAMIASILTGVVVVAIAVWIRETISQSLERRFLIEKLRATRLELAAAERTAGAAEERARLAREIHDTLAQGFTSVIVHLEAAAAGLDPADERAGRHIRAAEDVARSSLADARSIVWALRPDSIRTAGLPAALRRVAETMAGTPGAPAVDVEISGESRPLPMDVEVTLLRAAQEALANVRRHAAASRVVATLTYFDDEVSLDVADDGRGFDPAIASTSGGMGLLGMRERASALGGRLDIESSAEGTTIAITLPAEALPDRAAEGRTGDQTPEGRSD
jgi:signal transduction histidine kinase